MKKRLYRFGLPAAAAWAQPADCNVPASSPSVTLDLPASPLAAVAPTGDGCWLFVSLVSGGKGGIARDTEAQRFRKNKRRSPRWQGPRE